MDGATSIHWAQAPSIAVNFCIEVAVQDGLSAAPFDLHPTRQGPLQRRGFDVAAWRRWVTATAARSWPCDRANLNPPFDVPAVQTLDAGVRGALSDAWSDFLPRASRYKDEVILALRVLNATDARVRLASRLRSLAEIQPSLMFFLVRYDAKARPLVVAPGKAIVAAGWSPSEIDPAHFDRLWSAARQLAGVAA